MAKVENNTGAFKDKSRNLVNAALNEIARTGNADLVANCVVHKVEEGEKYYGTPGTLRRGHAYKIEGLRVTWGNYVYYAPYVEFINFRKKGRRDWFRKTLRADAPTFKKILEKHLGGL